MESENPLLSTPLPSHLKRFKATRDFEQDSLDNDNTEHLYADPDAVISGAADLVKVNANAPTSESQYHEIDEIKPHRKRDSQHLKISAGSNTAETVRKSMQPNPMYEGKVLQPNPMYAGGR